MHATTKAKALGLFVILGLMAAGAVVSAAPIKEIAGTQADVRAYCTGDSRHLIEGGSYALCVTKTANVICREDGQCESTDLEFAPGANFRDSEVAGTR